MATPRWGARAPVVVARGVPSPGPRRGDTSSVLKSFLPPAWPGLCWPTFPLLLFFSPVTRSFGTLCLNRALSSADFCGAG